ncbi:MAG: hypothetical protein ACLU6Y_03605 [Ruminococcus sp.]
MQECEDIKRQLPISFLYSALHGTWKELGKVGMEQISTDLGVSRSANVK